jgi:hypothetical protein
MLKEKIIERLNEFEPISLAEMDEVRLMNRVDTKFAFSIGDFIELLPELSDAYRVLEIEGTRTPFYESLYLDDENFNFFKDHHRGRSNRFKVRFRKYVESNIFFLEIKEKIKGRTRKKRIKVDAIPDKLEQNHLDFIKSVIPKEHDLHPVMWNSFHRITLVNKREKERLTLDFDLKFKWDDQVHNFDNLVIAELKQESVQRTSAFFAMMKKRMIRPYRLSKYCIGSIEIYGTPYLKYNRFKKKLLHLKKINEDAA